MDSRFRKELTTVPAVQIKVSKQGFVTTIGWHGDAQETRTPWGEIVVVAAVRCGRSETHGYPALCRPIPF